MEEAEALAISRAVDECDLIMRGGITSGVVFPKAIVGLAHKYRFVSIGGTSAGSIAAVMAAAAEYRRATATTEADRAAGFAVVDRMAAQLGSNLKTLFQPSPATRPLFTIAMRVIASGGSKSAFLVGALLAFWGPVAIAAAPGLLLLLWAVYAANFWMAVVAVLALLVGPAVAVAVCLWNAVTVVLPAHDYGICSGLSADASGPPAFTDWIAGNLDEAAGRNPGQGGYKPLTVGDLRTAGGWPPEGGSRKARISVASVTTDLSSGRPFQLPLGTKIFSFRKSEFDRLFPTRIVDYLTQTGGRQMAAKGSTEPFRDASGNSDYYRLPDGDDFPILLVARLSLSFPGLISAVPLYRKDYTVKDESGKSGVFVRCLFSDGGITSNFPIHFFDSLLPGRPTFGISLGSVDKRDPGAPRVSLPGNAREGSATAAHAIIGLLNFAGAILDTARNWQDSLQSRLHGYRERIVEIRLDDEKEGGLNLDMDSATIGRLVDFGGEAAAKLSTEFRFDEHRWRRAVTALPALGEALGRFSKVWDDGYRTLLTDYVPEGLVTLSPAERKVLAEFADRVAAAGEGLADKPLPKASAQRATLRVVASIDTDGDEDAVARPPPPSRDSVPVS